MAVAQTPNGMLVTLRAVVEARARNRIGTALRKQGGRSTIEIESGHAERENLIHDLYGLDTVS